MKMQNKSFIYERLEKYKKGGNKCRIINMEHFCKVKMNIIEIMIVSLGLAMDAFAVSICKGLSMYKMNLRKTIIVGLYFGIFQAIMPIIGYFLGRSFGDVIISIDHWVIFILLGIIGINMIIEAIKGDEESIDDSVDFRTMTTLAIATSIDALAVGIGFAFLRVNIIESAVIIGIISFILSIIGVKIGNLFGDKYKKKSEIVGGTILIAMGIKTLLEHLGIINF